MFHSVNLGSIKNLPNYATTLFEHFNNHIYTSWKFSNTIQTAVQKFKIPFETIPSASNTSMFLIWTSQCSPLTQFSASYEGIFIRTPFTWKP